MLVFFAAKNLLSLKERQEFSFVPYASYKEAEETLLNCPAVPGGKLLPCAVIYGPNASGKSNIIAALKYLQNAVRLSHRQAAPDGGVSRNPFLLSAKCREVPTEVEIEFVLREMRYQYGFCATNDLFLEEWLYFYPKNRRQMLFERTKSKVRFGRSLKGQNKVISEIMRPNSLFVSAAAQNGHEQLSPIFTYISSIDFDANLAVSGFSLSEMNQIDPRTIEFLQQIGTGVVGFRAKELINPKGDAMVAELKALVARHLEYPPEEIPAPSRLYLLELAHQGDLPEPVYFEIERESNGTRRLLLVLNSVFNALDKGSLLIIDELDASFHTQIGETILSLFSDQKINMRGAQLIATTHDTNLMVSDKLRRDQIWFTEKDHEGASHLYPLSDIRTRNTDNIEKGYLQGRYGAIPFSGSPRGLLSTSNK
jgi:AAA15 family ATPase/GTPase